MRYGIFIVLLKYSLPSAYSFAQSEGALFNHIRPLYTERNSKRKLKVFFEVCHLFPFRFFAFAWSIGACGSFTPAIYYAIAILFYGVNRNRKNPFLNLMVIAIA